MTINYNTFGITLAILLLSIALFTVGMPSGNAAAADCIIPVSGAWPACARGGGGDTVPTPVASSGCVIPTHGAWPACARDGGRNAAAAPVQPAPSTAINEDNEGCVIPTSGAWPACARNGSGSIAPSQPAPIPTATPAPDTMWMPPIRPNSPTHTLGQLASLPEDTRVTVRANVVSTESFSKGYKFTIADRTGRVVMLTWSSVYDDCTQCRFVNIGAEVIVSGVIDNFEGEVQIVPLFGDAVQVTKPAPTVPGRQIQIEDLRLYHDQRVKLEATVQRLNKTQYGMEIVVNDGTGEAEIFFWNNNWQRVPENYKIKSGTIIRVAGIVDEFRQNYTITPPLPYDIEIVTP